MKITITIEAIELTMDDLREARELVEDIRQFIENPFKSLEVKKDDKMQ